MRPFISFFGAKWYHAKRYRAPSSGLVVEPFAGSAGFSVRHAVPEAILVEKDPVIAGVWKWLIESDAEDVMQLPMLEPGQHLDEIDAPEPAKNLIGFWLNKGHPTPCKTMSAWGRDPRYASQFWGPKIRSRIASQVEQISRWTVIEGDYTKAPDIAADWFIDPPYYVKGHHYRCGSGGIDYAHLAQWCRHRRGRVQVCEQKGAEWLPFRELGRFKSTTRKTGQDCRSKEVVWTNG